MSCRRGNPNWGRPTLPMPVVATEFEVTVRQLGLTPDSSYLTSRELKAWCHQNRNHRYVPEKLLEKWGMVVEIHYGLDAA